MEVESYDSLFTRITNSLSYSTDLSRKAFVSSHFSSALVECESCITQALNFATKLLEETNFQVTKLCEYIENAITLLQMLSGFIKSVLESAVMTCCSMKPFPTTTGNIILTVYMHCKDSEWIYGKHLKSVEMQLKDLFRTCHELQLTYLMTLEKHFIFDLTEKDEQEILIEALNINMKIGEIVQALDIKTMAEQWKAYTVICEKYSSFLLDKNIYNRCTQLFAKIIMDNIKTAMECDNDNKSVVRSLKVANFTIKILSRISNIICHAVSNSYEHLLELIEYIYMHNSAHLEILGNKSQQFINLVITNVLNSTDGLCNILVQDERFFDCIYKIDVKSLEMNALLGHIILIITVIKAVVQKKEDQVLNSGKRKLIDCVYRILPLGHYWFNLGLRFHSKSASGVEKCTSLYEHLLIHVVALATTFTSEQYSVLEQHMFEAVMSTECYSAMFSCNLWVLLIRISNDQLASNTLFSLIKVYQKIENHGPFQNSPQEAYLTIVIEKLFAISSNEVKRTMCKQIQPRNALWSVLKVSNLPDSMRRNVEATVFENFKTSFRELFESHEVSEKEIDNMVQIMKIASTCTFSENYSIEQYVVKLWCKVCFQNGYIQSEDLDTAEAMWYLKYLGALVALTESVADRLNSASVGKVLHNISTVLTSCNTEITVLLVNLFCKLTFNSFGEVNQNVLANIFKHTFKIILQNDEAYLKSYSLNILSKYRCNEQFHEITSELFYEDETLQKQFNLHCGDKTNYKSPEWKQQLTAGVHFEYTHKCRKIAQSCIKHEGLIQNTESNFDLGGFFFDEDIEEPSSKKAKLDTSEADSLVESLENDTSLLCQVDHAALNNHKKRILDIINKLNNIVS